MTLLILSSTFTLICSSLKLLHLIFMLMHDIVAPLSIFTFIHSLFMRMHDIVGTALHVYVHTLIIHARAWYCWSSTQYSHSSIHYSCLWMMLSVLRSIFTFIYSSFILMDDIVDPPINFHVHIFIIHGYGWHCWSSAQHSRSYAHHSSSYTWYSGLCMILWLLRSIFIFIYSLFLLMDDIVAPPLNIHVHIFIIHAYGWYCWSSSQYSRSYIHYSCIFMLLLVLHSIFTFIYS